MKGKVFLQGLILATYLLILSVPHVIAQCDMTYRNPICKCDFDFDCDGDANDVTEFLNCFGRNQYNNPCPPCVTNPWCSSYQP